LSSAPALREDRLAASEPSGAAMYNPPHFREDRVPVLHEAIRQAGLATLVTLGPDGLVASHIPLLLDPEPAPYGTLLGHLARGNPQERSRSDGEALAIFLGPESYVTPSWYATKRATGKVVPSWNYVAIHAYGKLELFDDAERLLALVTRLTRRHEAGRAEPWEVSDAPDDYVRGMLRGIVGFAMPIARLEGKWKMSQNQSAADRAGVAQGLAREGDATVAAIVAASSKRPGES
jgi:transcriptional regulator